MLPAAFEHRVQGVAALAAEGTAAATHASSAMRTRCGPDRPTATAMSQRYSPGEPATIDEFDGLKLVCDPEDSDRPDVVQGATRAARTPAGLRLEQAARRLVELGFAEPA